MATSITTLALDIAAEKSVRAAKPVLAPIGKFAHSFAAAEAEKGDTVKVPVFAAGAAYDFSSSNNYTSATEAGVSGKNIELNKHKWASQRLLPDDAMETEAGRDWVEQTTAKSVEAVAKALIADCFTELCTGATGTLTLSGTKYVAKVVNARTATVAAGICPEESTLVVPPLFFSELLGELPFNVWGDQDPFQNGYVDRILGFGRIAEANVANFTIGTGSDAKTYKLDAAVVENTAFGIATRLPIVMNPEKFEVSDISLPEVGPWSFRVRSTGTASDDAKFLGAELIYGVKVLKPAEILIAKTEVQG